MSEPRITFSQLVRLLRHPLRLGLLLMAAWALVGPFASAFGLMGMGLGVTAGMVAGELAGTSRVRARLWLVALLALAVGGRLLTWLLVSTRLASLLTPALALELAGFVGFSLGAFLTVATLRGLAVRRPVAGAVEGVVIIAATAHLVAGHRDGALGRPLWLGDQAWALGIEPTSVLLGLGAVLGVAVAMLFLLDARTRLPRLTWLVAPALAVLALLFADLGGVLEPPEAEQLNALGGEEPERPPGDAYPEGSAGGEAGEGEGAGPGGDAPPGGGSGGEAPAGGGSGGEAPAGGPGGPGEAAGGPGEAAGGPGGEAGGPGAPGGEGGAADAGGAPSGGPEEGSSAGGAPGGAPGPAGGEGSADGAEADDPGEGGASGGEGESEGASSSEGKEDSEEPSAPEPVAVLLLGDDFDPPQDTWYLRQGALSVYDGRRLLPAGPREDLDRDVLRQFPTGREEVDETPPLDGRVAVTGSVTLIAEHPGPFGPEAPLAFGPRKNPDPSRFVRSWTFESLAFETPYEAWVDRAVGHPDWTDAQREAWTAHPDDSRYRELTQEIVAELPEDAADAPVVRALAVKRWLDTHMVYDSSRKDEGSDDPAGSFLFGDLHGYCTHAAHAAVFLMRELDVPSRIGIGYAVPAEQRRGSTLVVLGSQAHAWPEIYLEGSGWVVLDIAPMETLDPISEPLDDELIRQLGEMARAQPEDDAAEGPDLGAIRDMLRAMARALGSSLVAILLIALGVALAGLYGTKLWRRARPWWAPASARGRVTYRVGLDLLAEAGMERRFGETRERFARRAAVLAPSFDRLTALHLSDALGASPGQTSRDAWRDALSAVRGDLAAAVPAWRRIAGVADPLSFTRSR